MTRMGFSCLTRPAPSRSASNSGQLARYGFAVFSSQPVSASVGNVKLLAQHRVHAGNHVLDNLRWRIPDAEFLAQFGIEGCEKWFIEILDGVIFNKSGEKFSARYTVESGGSPVQHVIQAK